ncbi:hypothetical protein VTJ83DRAFT_5759 [Remersonia thermophila]|uniref:Fungal lipase-type domain-containing protein n=1 Tax=Remersonia thermophila TaxID=72144 RepID=A0ABR4D7S0_9PEZI
MKGFLVACLSLAGTALGAPKAKLNTKAQATGDITPELVQDFHKYLQWSEAAGCNNRKQPGEQVTCQVNSAGKHQCHLFESHNATVVASFGGDMLDTRGFVGVDHVDKIVVLSYRGTTSVRNWIADLSFFQMPCDLTKGCLVHSGFYASWLEVKKASLDAVNQAKAANPTYKVIVTGYSLGAAVATLAVGYVRKAGHAADLYTYASPRVGNLALVDFITNQPGGEYRLTHKDDPVPRLPPIIFNYRHTSPEYWLNEDDDGVVTPDEVTYCPGYTNTSCNAATRGLDDTNHGGYFQTILGCGVGYTPWRRDLTSKELFDKLNHFAELDRQYAETLHKAGEQ